MSEALVINHLSVGFEGENPSPEKSIVVVDDLSFHLHPGETLAVLGESGCGKSLTSLALMRLLPEEAAYGQRSQVLFGQEELLELPEKQMRDIRGRRMAMIFQEPMTALNPVLTIAQQLAECLSSERLSHKALWERMVALLTEVDISNPVTRLKQYPHQLSGGQKQRVVIAMALARHPEVLIADEPTTALDTTTQAQILDLIKHLQQRYQMSILLITHDLNVVRKMADRVCVMYAGQFIEVSSISSFIQAPKHPYAQQLLASLPSFAKRGERLNAIGGCVPSVEARPTGCRFHPRCAHAFAPCPVIEPQMQKLSDGRLVRCHLYPEHQHLPSLPETKENWVNPSHPNDVLLSVEHLAVYFQTKKSIFRFKSEPFKAVDDLTFELRRGKTLAIVGESGCGKSTVCKSILRLQPITHGTIMFQGVNINALHGAKLKAFHQKVQIVFQDPFSSMNPRMTIADILSEGMIAQGMNRALIRQKMTQLLDQVNLPQKSLTRFPHQFSGGQRQRICIARALATSPEVLICDEPTSALDISVQAQILNLLKSLQYELGLSYLFITHNMNVVSYIADDVLVMRNGREIERGSCEEILFSPKMDYTKLLLSSLNEAPMESLCN